MEWNRRNVMVALLILVIGFGGGGAMFVHQVGWFQGGPEFAWFRAQKWVDGLDGEMMEMTPAEEREAKKKAKRIYQAVLEKYPSLRLEEEPVPRERNGFYAMIELTEDARIKSLSDSGALKALHDEEMDIERLRKELGTFEEIGLEIERVAALPERSSVEVPDAYTELQWAGSVKTMHDYLLLKSCVAAADQDEEEAFRYLALAVNLLDHLGEMAKINLLSETVYMLLKLAVLDVIFEEVLPRLGESVDLETWGRLITSPSDLPQRYAAMLRGEFWFFCENYGFTMFGDLPDPEKFLYAYAEGMAATISELEEMNFEQFQVFNGIPHETFSEGISPEGIAMFEITGLNIEIWNRSLIRGHVAEARGAAAFDLLMRERAGEDLSSLSETYLLNPETGKPFAYDAASRTLPEIPVANGGLSELKLPW